MNASQILKLALNFEQQTKKASIQQNMAKRIFFSLLGKLVPLGETSRIALTKGVVDFQALKTLIPGAKELIEYGTLACANEIKFYLKDRTKFVQAKQFIESGDFKSALNLLIQVLSDKEYWEKYEVVGGDKWILICKTLLNIEESIQNAADAAQQRDYDSQQKYLMEMTSFVNILDGLAHNTGSIMEKIVNIEKDRYPEIEYTPKDIERLMNAKELENHEDVLGEIMPILSPSIQGRKYKQQGGLSDWLDRARQSGFESDPEKRERELEFIQSRKILTNWIEYLKPIQNDLNRWSRMADSKVHEEIFKGGKRNGIEKVSRTLKKFSENVATSEQFKPELARLSVELKRIHDVKPEIGSSDYRKLLNYMYNAFSLMHKVVENASYKNQSQ